MNRLGVAVTVAAFISVVTACPSRDAPAGSPAKEQDLRARASERASSAAQPAAPGAQPAAPGTEHGAAHGAVAQSGVPYDLKFIDTMAAHHKGAIDMAKLAATRAQHQELKDLAAKIVSDQTKENEQMKAWREQWFAGKPQAADHSMPGMRESMQGMDMNKLRAARGADFDHLFIDMMIPHHEGAIAMAKDAQGKVQKPELTAMLDKVVKEQQKEIDQMKSWSAAWFEGHKH